MGEIITKKRIKAGVIGAGSWAIAMHIPILIKREEVDLVAACTQNDDALKHLKEELKIDIVSKNEKDVLEQELDLIVVASPPSLHYKHTKLAIESGANVLCEKPFTLNPEEAWELYELAKQKNRHLLVAFGWNYREFTDEAKSLITKYGIGDVQHSMVQMATAIRSLLKTTEAFSSPDASVMPDHNTWTNPNVSGGGYAPAQLSHALGILYYLFPELKVEEVFSLMNFEDARVDLHNAISIKFNNGSTGVVSGATSPEGSNYSDLDEWSPRHQLVLRIYGSEGQIVLDYERDFFWFYKDDGTEIKKNWPGGGLYECDGPVNTLIDLSLNKKSENKSDAEVAAKTVETLWGAYKSVDLNKSVILNEKENEKENEK